MTTTAKEAIRDAVENGHTTTDEICEATGYAMTTVQNRLAEITDAGEIERTREGRGYVYALPSETDQGADDADTDTDTDADASEGLTSQTTITPPAAEANVDDDPLVTLLDEYDLPGVDALKRRLEADAAGDADDEDDSGLMPVNREYLKDLDGLVPEVSEYIPHDGELTRLKAQIAGRELADKHVHFSVGGGTGVGKTHLVNYLAMEFDLPLFEIQAAYTMDEADLLGSPSITDGDSQWVDNVLTKALLASQERPVMLLIDEVNRARAEAKSVLFPVLDDRCRATLDGPRGGEVIKGDPQNLIVAATYNKGAGHHGLQETDVAERRRLRTAGNYTVDYLGLHHPDREAQLIADRAPVSVELGHVLVQAANDVRRRAKDATSLDGIEVGVPVGATTEWAKTAFLFEEAGVENPVYRAAQDVIINGFYEEDPDAAQEVDQIIRSRVDGCPVDADDLAEWIDDDLRAEIENKEGGLGELFA